jgi:hypothetical protein
MHTQVKVPCELPLVAYRSVRPREGRACSRSTNC